MGRKPNPLILEFFSRGPKLEDQSNRYEHTCKMCGMLFPKGRPDSMNRHLFEKCPSITEFDKARAFAYAQGHLDTQIQRPANHFGHGDGRAPEHANVALNREPSALDTLAEVSRQHLDLSRQRFQGDQTGMMQHDPAMDTHEMDGWMIQLQQQLAEANDVEDSRSHKALHNHTDANPLVETASAANQLSASLERHSTPPTRVALGQRHMDSPIQSTEPINLDPGLQAYQSSTASTSSHQQASSQSSHTIPRIPHTRTSHDAFQEEIATGFGLLARPLKKQRRMRFSAERRKEVGGMRKLGACLRCRMLKKPCSGDTPCATCSMIGAPRVWACACIRTRIADEFTLYNTSYFFAKAREQVNKVVGSTQMKKSGGCINVSIFQGKEDGRLSLPALQTCETAAAVEGENAKDTTAEASPDTLHILQVETQDAIKAVERYLDLEHERFVSAEQNKLLRTTLETLKLLDPEHKDVLVARTILLWAATTILIDPSTFDWHIEHVTPSETSVTGDTVVLDATRKEFSVLQSQTLDAVERFAAQAVKQVCNELERRLLARNTSTSMITFLVAVMLMNCVERMSLLFRTFDTREALYQAEADKPKDADADVDVDVSTLGAPPDWPLTRPPEAYFMQGLHFSHLLRLLLRMRSLPPKTLVQPLLPPGALIVIKPHGRQTLTIPPDPSVLPPSSPQQLDQEDLHLAQLATWLDRAALTVEDLLDCALTMEDHVGASGNGKGARQWDLRFVAPLVLPDEWEFLPGEMGAVQREAAEAEAEAAAANAAANGNGNVTGAGNGDGMGS
ncbi:hypothetical protein ANO11243_041720 [Dothideomycetidae sp. 11243]|nr:hypothetical protein ANO11243_041720 [fungal sp. No.11243]